MKKILGLLTIGVFVVLNGFAENYTLSLDETRYIYDHGKKKCTINDFEFRKVLVNDYRSGKLIVDKKYENDAGIITISAVDLGDDVYNFITSTTFGACRVYEDVVIKDIKDFNIKNYVGLKEAKVASK